MQAGWALYGSYLKYLFTNFALLRSHSVLSPLGIIFRSRELATLYLAGTFVKVYSSRFVSVGKYGLCGLALNFVSSCTASLQII